MLWEIHWCQNDKIFGAILGWKHLIAQSALFALFVQLIYVATTDMWNKWLLRQKPMCDVWSVIGPLTSGTATVLPSSSQLAVTTNRPNIDPTHLSDVHNTENIDRPLARDLTTKIFSATKKCQFVSINKCASYNFTSLSHTCLKCPAYLQIRQEGLLAPIGALYVMMPEYGTSTPLFKCSLDFEHLCQFSFRELNAH